MKRTIAFFCGVCLLTSLVSGETVSEPFNGKDLTGWKTATKVKPQDRDSWRVGTAVIAPDAPKEMMLRPMRMEGGKPLPAEMVNLVGGDWKPRGMDLYTEMTYGDCTIDLEFMVSKGSNSGVYVMGEYEVQILDSWGKETMGPGDLGALYGAAPPKVNAALEPGVWQRMVIEFTAPKFDAEGKKTANARFVKITINDKVVQENVEMQSQTPSGVTGKEAPLGPLMFQGNHGAVAFRNIKIICP